VRCQYRVATVELPIAALSPRTLPAGGGHRPSRDTCHGGKSGAGAGGGTPCSRGAQPVRPRAGCACRRVRADQAAGPGASAE